MPMLLQAPSVRAAQARTSPTCNLTQLAELGGTCCSSQILAWFEIAANPALLGPGTSLASNGAHSTQPPISCALALARALGPLRIAFVGDSVLQQVGHALIGALDESSGFISVQEPAEPPAPTTQPSRSALPVSLRDLCQNELGVNKSPTPCRHVRFTSGLEIAVIKAYGFNAAAEPWTVQAARWRTSKANKGFVETRTLTALLAYTDLVLIEPCGVHTETLSQYREHVSRALGQVNEGLRWLREHKVQVPRASRVLFLADIPQHFKSEHGMYTRHSSCEFEPLNATTRFRSRSQLSGLPTHLQSYLQKEQANRLDPNWRRPHATRTTTRAKPKSAPLRDSPSVRRLSIVNPPSTGATRLQRLWARLMGGGGGSKKEAAGAALSGVPANSRVEAEEQPPDWRFPSPSLTDPLLSRVVSAHVVDVSPWMAPFGVMAKCGGRHYNNMNLGCDCTHFCSSQLTFAPWFSALHAALPTVLASP